MNENKIDFLARIQQNHILNGDFNSELGNCSSQYFDIRNASNIGNFSQPFSMEQSPYIVQSQNHVQGKSSSNTIISRFESPTSAFYATEICMGFPQYDYQVGNNNINNNNGSNPFLISQQFSNKVNDLEFPLYQCPRENNLYLDSTNQTTSHNFELSNLNPLQPLIRSQLNSDQCCKSPENSNGGNFLFIDDASTISMSPLIHSNGNHDHKVSIYYFIFLYFTNFLID
jgi:hypothetical protein